MVSIDDVSEQVPFPRLDEYDDEVIAFYGEDSSFYITN